MGFLDKIFGAGKAKSTGILDLMKTDLSRYGAGLVLKFYEKSSRDKALQVLRKYVAENKTPDRRYVILTSRTIWPYDRNTYSHFIFVMSPHYRRLLFDLGSAIDSGNEEVIGGLYDMKKQLACGEIEGVTRATLISILKRKEMCFESEEWF